MLDGQAHDTVFGATGGGEWFWQEGGAARIAQAETRLALHDLTGFEGRCDAILFVKDAPEGWRPPAEKTALAKFRREALKLGPPQDAGEFDLVVVGGGYAGLCAAVAAARLDLKVALIQDRPVLGGNASSEVRVGPIGKTEFGPFKRNADIVDRLIGAQDPVQEKMVTSEKNISLFLNTRADGVEMNGTRIAVVRARNTRTSQELRFRAPLFADCTGDGMIGFLAGAEFRTGREGRDETGESLAPEKGDRQYLGNTLYWYSTERAEAQPFPACPWALVMPSRAAFEVAKPKYPPKISRPDMLTVGEWNWEGGFNKDTITQAEQIRDHNFRAIYGTWDFLKNRGDDKARYANWKLTWMAFQMGKRESRRLLGDYLLTQQDIEKYDVKDDGVVTATWYFDIHFPHPQNTKYWPGEEFRSLAFDDPNFEKFRGDIPGREIKIQPYPIPYRCFYSRNVPNLFMAGRDISVTHAALSHDDAMIHFIEQSAWRKLPVGMGMHWQRYAMEPWSVDLVQTPADQGGALGFVEPILHSSGHGVIAEYEADPAVLAAQMKDARERIAAIAGARFAPRGVYCYLDTSLADPTKKPEALWRAIHAAGFEYVISSASPGENKVLFREGDFIVINQTAVKVEKTSPFVRIKDPADMLAAEKKLRDAGQPGWVIGTLDAPLYGYAPYLVSGHKWGQFLRMDAFYDYLQRGAKERGLIPATPHTIARYARILAEDRPRP